ncbi:uncharacterized protein LOC106172435 [Lingula anatina]|uniref:Uncharacterized protein LOC106172435 n=1 Tax=Lingula anatina TaxID=7574 RepID=A0A1S3JDX4_LINAN|nr:uncharacterized protein LOC106172435 [Lingula anatina]|eukprot:XP_013408602.1 uncharacterized protein LOC106172435 [Lingula anatina]
MSHDAVVKTVAKKLKYYFEVKRREDGFDLSGPNCPRLDHPHLKPRATLQYDGLHDKPVKHYFHDPKVRQAITNMTSPRSRDKVSKEHVVRRKVDHHMARHRFIVSAFN